MARAGYCSECGTNVWLAEDGSCTNGHSDSCVSNVYETAPPPLQPTPAKPGVATWVVVAAIFAAAVPLLCGIAAAIAIPVFNSASASARQKACWSNQRTIEGAVQQYLASDPNATPPIGPVDENSVLITAGFLKSPPQCRLGDRPYECGETGQTNCPYGDPPGGHGHY